MKNQKKTDINMLVWFDGTNINEALFCDDFLASHKILYSNGDFYMMNGNRALIKREKFERYLDMTTAV